MRGHRRNLRLAAILCAAVTYAGSLAAGPMEDAEAAFKRGDNKTAIGLLRPLADAGNAEAQFHLGGMYDSGVGVSRDYGEAIKWYRRAAEKGQVQAQINLGFKYQSGQGVDKDAVQAVRWFRRAAEQGNALGQLNLAMMYRAGQGVLQNNTEAAKWFLLSANQGNPIAQLNLGMIYGDGRGVQRDYVESYKWFSLAGAALPASRSQPALNNRDTVAKLMTPEQIEEARKRALAWKPAR
jgi:uncharacterized protein